MPNLAVERFVVIIVARHGGPLFDSAGRRVIWILRATYSIAVAGDLDEAVARIRALKEGIGGAKKYSACRSATINNHNIRSVGFLADDIRIGLLNPKARRGDIHNGDNSKGISRCARARDRGLADRREHCPRTEVACCCSSVIIKIGRVERPVHGDERAAITRDCARGIELVGRSISDVLDLAAYLITYPNVSKRTSRRDIHKWSYGRRVNCRPLRRIDNRVVVARCQQAPSCANRGCKQRQARAQDQFCFGFHLDLLFSYFFVSISGAGVNLTEAYHTLISPRNPASLMHHFQLSEGSTIATRKIARTKLIFSYSKEVGVNYQLVVEQRKANRG
jgi:hypothetical protein